MGKTITLEIKKPKSNLLHFSETEVEVDYDTEGMIWEVRIWNDFLDEMVPVQMNWLQKNLPSRFARIEEQVTARLEAKCIPQYQNDDPNPAA